MRRDSLKLKQTVILAVISTLVEVDFFAVVGRFMVLYATFEKPEEGTKVNCPQFKLIGFLSHQMFNTANIVSGR